MASYYSHNVLLIIIVMLLTLACLSAAQEDIIHNATAEENVTAENGHSATAEGEEEEEHIEPVYAVLMPWFVQAVGVVIYFLLTRIKYIRGLPYTCALFITGMFMGSGAVRTGFQDQLTESIGLWRAIDHEVLFLGKKLLLIAVYDAFYYCF